jgi:L-lactate dehydrogenase (cytochrome)
MSSIADCLNVLDFRDRARSALPEPIFEYLEGGADDEVTMRANTSAFDHYHLVPSYLRDIRKIDMGRTVFGCLLEWPVILAPTGLTRVFHPDGEIAVAEVAASQGTAYALSTMGTTSIEEVAAATKGPKIFQLYLFSDDALNFALIDRCKEAGFDAICITVDTVVAGNRERDRRAGLTVPPRLTRKNLLHFATRPSWCFRYLAMGGIGMPNIPSAEGGDLGTLAAYFASRMEQNITWARIERLMAYWGKPFAVKGLQSVEDARRAADAGVSGIIVSNHGGRQLDGGAATIDLLAGIVDAVGGRLDIVLDSGIRRGSHVVKALAIGATACMIGRPYLYGLSAYGKAGAAHVVSLLRRETERTLALLGCANIDEVGRHHLLITQKVP